MTENVIFGSFKMMDRPVISPLNIHPTAPETFSVLQQRICVAEEQTESLISDLRALGVSSERFDCKDLENKKPADIMRPVSPLKARLAFTGDCDTLWKNCENLVNRMCHIESVMQTLKLSVFRMQTEMKLSPRHTAELEQRLNEVQEEYSLEIRDAQLQIMRLRQRLSSETEKREREEAAKERLSAALEIATATKTDVAIAAEEMKATKLRMNQRLRELQEQLSHEIALRSLLEEEQAVMLKNVHDMKQVVEDERAQVQELQQDCQQLRNDGQEVRERLQQQEEKIVKLEQLKMQLQADLEEGNSVISRLHEEVKSKQKCCDAQQTELKVIQADSVALREAAEKVQSLNQQLEIQCSELTTAVQKLTAKNVQLLATHKQEIKAQQETFTLKIQEQEMMLTAAKEALTAEIQDLQTHRTQLERELEVLRAEHTTCQKKAIHTEQKTATQRDLQDSTIARLRGDLESSLKEKVILENERDSLQNKLGKALNEFKEKKQNLEVELAEKKLELESVQSTLLAQEQENRRLLDRVATLEQSQNAQSQVEVLLHELMDSKNKLAYEKGKLQSTVEQLKSELQSFCDAQSENSQLRKRNTALETKYTQVNTDLGSCRIQLQRMESKLQQTQSFLLRKENDFTLAVQVRDEALREEKKLRALVEAAEEREKQNRLSMQQQLCDMQEERNRISSTLEKVLFSHTQLQQDLEKLQTELGRRDCEIAALLRDRTQSQKEIQKLQAELSEYQTRLLSIDTHQSGQLDPLHRAIEEARKDNGTLARSLDQALQENSILQGHVRELKKELQSKMEELDRLRQTEQNTKEEAHICEEKVEALKRQHQINLAASKKASRKEVTELKKALDSATAKSAELSQSNRELRRRQSALKQSAVEQREQIDHLKTQLTSHLESKACHRQSEKIQEIQTQLKHLKQVKEEYEKRNKEQSQHIQEFLAEVSSLRAEMATDSHKTQECMLRSELEKEMQLRMELDDKCKGLEERVQALQEEKEISLNLEEAHNWFHSRFEERQTELLKNRQKKKSQPSIGCSEVPPDAAVSLWKTKQELKLMSRYDPTGVRHGESN
ncbi:coiled-coil domain-containing protein 150 isoform X2 [Xenopus laevis]|uniref:Coiled-coil domain-containing protein 150 isoform X2 n=1 Tax=Xenopus laevis TaxID=8355 RepID=A0A8J0VBH0_XENLA|nr:coiled-coil domain-containing protein 150 isoform X2 [Xenopus laevis]